MRRGRLHRSAADAMFAAAGQTVGRHVENLQAKLGVHTRAAAAVFAMEQRLLDP